MSANQDKEVIRTKESQHPQTSASSISKDAAASTDKNRTANSSANTDIIKSSSDPSTEKESEQGNLLNDPIAFWSSWSEKQANCARLEEHQASGGKQSSCNCFEGMGSVM